MKRKLSILLTVVMVFLPLLPCVAIAEAPVQFEYFLNWSALPSTWDMSRPIFAGITAATGASPIINKPAEDATTKLNLMMVSGTMPDLITIDNRDLLREMIDSGLVWDLEEFFTTYLPESHLLKDYPQDVKQALIERDGGWYSYASHISSDDATSIWGYPEELKDYLSGLKYSNQFSIFFKQEYLDQIGVDVKSIDTEEKLLDTLQKLKEANLVSDTGASVYTMMIQGNNFDVYTLQALQMHFGAMPVTKDGAYQSYYYDPNYKHAVQFLNTCAQRGYFDENQITMDEPTFVALCNSGRVACYIGGISALQVGNDSGWVTPGPIASATGAQPVLPLSGAVSTGWLQTVVSKSTKYPEAVAKFIDYMTSREGMLLSFYGVEGEDYYWDEKGMLHRTEKGIEEREDGVSGNFGFYGFHYSSFSRSVEYVDLANVNDLTTAFGTSEKVFVYDSALLEPPSGYVKPNSEEAFIDIEVDTYAQSMLAQLIFADDDAAFEAMYQDFVNQLNTLGLPKYDVYINEAIQAKYEKAGQVIADINEK